MYSFSRRVILGVTLTLVLAVVFLPAQGPDPALGTWKVNVAKSTYDPGPGPKAGSRTNVDRGGGVWISTNEGINAQGNPTFNQIAYKFDGQDYPWAIRGSQTINTISLRRPDTYTYEFTIKVDGKATLTTSGTISKDGKTITERTKGMNAQGKPVNNVVVFEK